MSRSSPHDPPWRRHPHHLLQLTPAASAAEVERAGQKLLAMLAVGLDTASTYAYPGGEQQRTDTDVRWAMAELRDPHRRALWELWWSDPTASLPDPPQAAEDPFCALGWRR